MNEVRPTDPNPVIDALLARLWAGEESVIMIGAYEQMPDDPSRHCERPADYIDLSSRLRSYGVAWHTGNGGTRLFRVDRAGCS